MYFFYFDESGTRDPSVGTPSAPKDHIYVLLAVGMYEGQWRRFETATSGLKLRLVGRLRQAGKGPFDLADCEVKSTFVRIPRVRAEKSPFLNELSASELNQLTEEFYSQVISRRTVILASVIDKRHLRGYVTHEILHKKAYEFLLERIQHYIREYHPRHRALVIMDDTNRNLNRAVAMKHAWFQRTGNQNMQFPAIVEYPFFTRSELSNGVQLADLLAYNVYRAFKTEDFRYSFFRRMIPSFYRRRQGWTLDGLKVWPDDSPLVRSAERAWDDYVREGGASTFHPQR